MYTYYEILPLSYIISKKKTYLLRKLKYRVVCNIVFCVIFEISFIGRCKNNFNWLLVIEKMKKRVN